MYELFKDFLESKEGYDFDFDNGLVCRWLKGAVKISPKITTYYAEAGNIEALAVDIEENILPLLYDKDMAVTEVYNLLVNDSTVRNGTDFCKTRRENKSAYHFGSIIADCAGVYL